jgi:hypothetical protein
MIKLDFFMVEFFDLIKSQGIKWQDKISSARWGFLAAKWEITWLSSFIDISIFCLLEFTV